MSTRPPHVELTHCFKTPLFIHSKIMSDFQPITPEEFPINEDLSNFEVPYYPEEFTEEEQRLLNPFFTNLDKPVFIIRNLPAETVGALSSRYSRVEGGIRKVFLKEYIQPIVNPESQKSWESFTEEERAESENIKNKFYEYLQFIEENGGPDDVVNLQRARKFYSTWLSQFGDDSIAEMGTSIPLCIEGISNIGANAIQGQRIGVSSLEKSSRYVFFGDKNPEGNYKFVIPGEIKGTGLEIEYIEVMTLLFDTYVELLPIHLDTIKALYPKGEKETDRSFLASRKAKVFDDLRDLLPFSTQTSLGLNISGRAAEQLINRLLSDQNGEVRWWGQQITTELAKVIPSFIERPTGKRGAEQQAYKKSIRLQAREMAANLNIEAQNTFGPNVELISYTPEPDVEILARYLFEGSRNAELSSIRNKQKILSPEERYNSLKEILDLRNLGEKGTKRENVRFRKPPRAFESAQFTFDITCRGGDYRDLHRHRMLTQGRPLFTANLGYDLESDVIETTYIEHIQYALERAAILNQKMAGVSPDAAQYAIPYAFLQRFYWTISAREIYWISELRTGPQGRPHYRDIAQRIAQQASKAAPGVFQGMRTDFNKYDVARRESELKKDKKG